jgi:hypothetical protein
MAVPVVWSRVLRVVRGVGSFLRELVVELVGEAVLTVLVCLTVAGLALAFVWGWGRSPLVAGGVGGAALAFLVYGGWEVLGPARPGGRGRLAGAAGTAFGVAAVFIAYAWFCGCWD